MPPERMVTSQRCGSGLTRVRPPGMAVKLPSLAALAKARQTSERGSTCAPVQVGVVERSSTS